ncbi:TetR/AcrR family transcriptional regulator [Nonomuraea rhizosphaerae]|uniref:TetR/AcrR family transcriptional regulator n=1 Tax=Nonomuraea rhizosphaerae TaxID=2665663 RepID=UPI001C5E79C6|nr:TetR/AcrR family transcriptional regulator [Nonomuraea rhizosphaerae]
MSQTEGGGYRERLLAAAVTCLQEKGYARTTARDLVAASGTNLASIGYHFGGKDALLSEAIASVFDAFIERVEQSIFGARVGTPREMLERAMAGLVDVFADMRPMLMLCIEGYPVAMRETVLREKLAAGYARSRRAGVDMLTRACAAMGLEAVGKPEVLVSVLIAITDGLMIQWLLDPDSTPDGQQVVEALAALTEFLKAP